MTDVPVDEAWGFEWGSADGAGGFVRLALHRTERIAWYWAYLLSPDNGPVVVRDHEVTLPRAAALEIRADSLWSELVCETPGEHWSIGLEAFGVRLDTAEDGLRGEIGERIALGFDLEWETTGEPFRSEIASAGGAVVRDEQPGVVRGEVLLGRGRMPLDTVGWFDHSVGREYAVDGARRARGACDDGSWWSRRREGDDVVGARWEAGRVQRRDGIDAGVEPRSAAVIPLGDRTVTRELGRISLGPGGGIGWIETVAPRVRRSPDGP